MKFFYFFIKTISNKLMKIEKNDESRPGKKERSPKHQID